MTADIQADLAVAQNPASSASDLEALARRLEPGGWNGDLTPEWMPVVRAVLANPQTPSFPIRFLAESAFQGFRQSREDLKRQVIEAMDSNPIVDLAMLTLDEESLRFFHRLFSLHRLFWLDTNEPLFRKELPASFAGPLEQFAKRTGLRLQVVRKTKKVVELRSSVFSAILSTIPPSLSTPPWGPRQETAHEAYSLVFLQAYLAMAMTHATFTSVRRQPIGQVLKRAAMFVSAEEYPSYP